MLARLLVKPCVVGSVVELRAFETFDDAKLRVESGFDCVLAKEALTKRMDGLRPQCIHAGQLFLAGPPVRLLLARRNFE